MSPYQRPCTLRSAWSAPFSHGPLAAPPGCRMCSPASFPFAARGGRTQRAPGAGPRLLHGDPGRCRRHSRGAGRWLRAGGRRGCRGSHRLRTLPAAGLVLRLRLRSAAAERAAGPESVKVIGIIRVLGAVCWGHAAGSSGRVGHDRPCVHHFEARWQAADMAQPSASLPRLTAHGQQQSQHVLCKPSLALRQVSVHGQPCYLRWQGACCVSDGTWPAGHTMQSSLLPTVASFSRARDTHHYHCITAKKGQGHGAQVELRTLFVQRSSPVTSVHRSPSLLQVPGGAPLRDGKAELSGGCLQRILADIELTQLNDAATRASGTPSQQPAQSALPDLGDDVAAQAASVSSQRQAGRRTSVPRPCSQALGL